MDPTLPDDSTIDPLLGQATGLLVAAAVVIGALNGWGEDARAQEASDPVALLCDTASAPMLVAVSPSATADPGQALAPGEGALKQADDGPFLHLHGEPLPVLALAPAEVVASPAGGICRDVTADLAPLARTLEGEAVQRHGRWEMARQVGSDG